MNGLNEALNLLEETLERLKRDCDQDKLREAIGRENLEELTRRLERAQEALADWEAGLEVY